MLNKGSTAKTNYKMIQLSFPPFPVLKTDRLILRQLHDDDTAAIALLRSDPAVNRFLDRAPATSAKDAAVFIKKINDGIAAQKSLYWVICFKEDQQFAGTICLWNIEQETAKAETGYELLPAFWGKGLMQEALEAVLRYVFEQMKLQTITAFSRHDNIKSIQLLDRNNFLADTAMNTSDGYCGYYLSQPA
jgi:[ribosomal protein S5]-alanine N-acetyltransferase